jgi:hypothetical protein
MAIELSLLEHNEDDVTMDHNIARAIKLSLLDMQEQGLPKLKRAQSGEASDEDTAPPRRLRRRRPIVESEVEDDVIAPYHHRRLQNRQHSSINSRNEAGHGQPHPQPPTEDSDDDGTHTPSPERRPQDKSSDVFQWPLVTAKEGDRPLLTKRLFDPSVTPADVTREVADMLPQLDIRTPRMKAFADLVAAQQYPEPTLWANHIPQQNTTFHDQWQAYLANEPVPKPGTYRSYPTLETTLHKYNSSIRDITNPSMTHLCRKTGFFDIDKHTKPIFMLDLFPRRLDRDAFTAASLIKKRSLPIASNIFYKLPRELVNY